jgi:hypothetical protein
MDINGRRGGRINGVNFGERRVLVGGGGDVNLLYFLSLEDQGTGINMVVVEVY